jgi:hypothetical protein
MTDFRAELQLLFDDAESFAEASLGHHYLWVAALNRARAALAEQPVGPTPIPVAPLINAGSERLRLVAGGICSGYMAGHNATVEGHYGDPDEVASEMASMVLAELGSVPQPEPVAPTDEELDEFAVFWWGSDTDERTVTDVIECCSMAAFARAALAKWGQP